MYYSEGRDSWTHKSIFAVGEHDVRSWIQTVWVLAPLHADNTKKYICGLTNMMQ